jgi:LmeA-like phospholipid-binding
LRGCLSVLIIAAAFLVGIVWFGGVPLAETVVEASLTTAAFEADELDVTVHADPPLVLALGRADRVEIEATGVRWEDLRAGSMSMRLDGVDLLGRTAITADGQFRDVELAVAGGDPALVGIAISGPAEGARTTIDIDGPTVNRVALAAFEAEFGTRPDSAELVAPNQVRVTVGGRQLGGTLVVEADGALVVETGLGKVRLVEPDPSIPLRLTRVSIVDGGLELTGTLDVSALLR